ncbi:MAG: hypothetical protein ACR2JS_00120 [Candidatus Nanopelagicales bacterium]
MKYFALLENDIVTNVVNVNDEDAPTESEGILFLRDIGASDQSVETFLDGQRGKFAAAGDIWDGTEFISQINTEVTA